MENSVEVEEEDQFVQISAVMLLSYLMSPGIALIRWRAKAYQISITKFGLKPGLCSLG